MSLQIWLPLNGNINNQGISNIIATNSNATINDEGKIGKCYYFNGTDARISFPSVSFNYPLSACAWVKGEAMTSSTTQYIFSYNTATGGGSGHKIGFGIYNCKLSIWHGGQNHNLNISLENNIWYHIVAVVTETSYFLYLNG